MLSLSYLLAGMVIVFFHIVASILVNMMAGKEVRATAQTLLVVFGSGVGPHGTNYLAGVLTQQAGNSLRPVFWIGYAACLRCLFADCVSLSFSGPLSCPEPRSFHPAYLMLGGGRVIRVAIWACLCFIPIRSEKIMNATMHPGLYHLSAGCLRLVGASVFPGAMG